MKLIQTYIDWFSKLEETIQKEIAFFMMSFLPNFDLTDLTDCNHIQKQFINFLEYYNSPKISKIKTTGLMLCIKSIMNFILKKRSTYESWSETKNFLDKAIKKAELQNSKYLDIIKEQCCRVDFIAEEWIKISQSWLKLNSQSFSEKELMKHSI